MKFSNCDDGNLIMQAKNDRNLKEDGKPDLHFSRLIEYCQPANMICPENRRPATGLGKFDFVNRFALPLINQIMLEIDNIKQRE